MLFGSELNIDIYYMIWCYLHEQVYRVVSNYIEVCILLYICHNMGLCMSSCYMLLKINQIFHLKIAYEFPYQVFCLSLVKHLPQSHIKSSYVIVKWYF